MGDGLAKQKRRGRNDSSEFHGGLLTRAQISVMFRKKHEKPTSFIPIYGPYLKILNDRLMYALKITAIIDNSIKYLKPKYYGAYRKISNANKSLAEADEIAPRRVYPFWN